MDWTGTNARKIGVEIAKFNGRFIQNRKKCVQRKMNNSNEEGDGENKKAQTI